MYNIPYKDARSLYDIGHKDTVSVYNIAYKDVASVHVKGHRVLVQHGVTFTAPRRRMQHPCMSKDAGSSYNMAYEHAAS